MLTAVFLYLIVVIPCVAGDNTSAGDRMVLGNTSLSNPELRSQAVDILSQQNRIAKAGAQPDNLKQGKNSHQTDGHVHDRRVRMPAKERMSIEPGLHTPPETRVHVLGFLCARSHHGEASFPDDPNPVGLPAERRVRSGRRSDRVGRDSDTERKA